MNYIKQLLFFGLLVSFFPIISMQEGTSGSRYITNVDSDTEDENFEYRSNFDSDTEEAPKAYQVPQYPTKSATAPAA